MDYWNGQFEIEKRYEDVFDTFDRLTAEDESFRDANLSFELLIIGSVSGPTSEYTTMRGITRQEYVALAPFTYCREIYLYKRNKNDRLADAVGDAFTDSIGGRSVQDILCHLTSPIPVTEETDTPQQGDILIRAYNRLGFPICHFLVHQDADAEKRCKDILNLIKNN